MKINKIFVLFVLLSFSSIDRTYAQGEVSNGYNPLSLRQVHESYLMWKKTLWRRVDLKEKQNKPFFAINREISKIILSFDKLSNTFGLRIFLSSSISLSLERFAMPIRFIFKNLTILGSCGCLE